jgi:predicted acetyltransferase
MTAHTFGPVPPDRRDDDALRSVARLPALAFGYTADETLPWYRDLVGTDNLRTLSRTNQNGATQTDAALGQVPMGLYIAGNRVDQLGVLGVAVAPEARGKGLARTLMAEAIRAMHADRVPLSVLYSAMHPLYRGVGYELAGILCAASIPAALFPKAPHPDPGSWREATPDDHPAIESLYDAYARTNNGMLARSGYTWQRIREREGKAVGFIHTDADGTPDAYTYLVQKKWAEPIDTTGTAAGARMTLTDLAWVSPAGLAALCDFLRGYTSVVGTIETNLPPPSPHLAARPPWGYAMKILNSFFVRITHPEAALLARGYSPAVTAAVTLDITDDTVPENTGRWTLAINAGTPTVERTTTPTAHTLAINIRDLAPLYTGYTTPRVLRDAGRARCDDTTADLAAGIFATPTVPAMTDMF